MSAWDKLFLAGYFLAIIIVQCIWQARLFKANKPISHFWQGVIYAATVMPAVWIFWPNWWQVPVIALVTRLAFFDFALNIIRGNKNLFYNSDTKAGSLQDRIENRLSYTWVKILKIAYVVVFVIVLIKLK